MTNILLLPIVQFGTLAPSNADMLDLICTFQNSGVAISLTGIAFRAMARPTADDPTVALDAQTTNWASSDITTPNGWLVSGDATGTLSWAVPQSKIGTMMDASFGIDILARADSHFVLVGQGTFSVTAGYTRWAPQV